MTSTATRVTAAAEGLPRRRFTVAEVEAMVAAGVMDEDERLELIGGELVPMSPEGIRHEAVKRALVDRWSRARPSDFWLVSETTFRLSEDTYLEPDIVIFPRSTGLTALSPENVRLVVEISDSSLRYDIGRKAALYASFGIRDLWVIDAVAMTARVFRAPSPEGYAERGLYTASDRIAPSLAPQDFALRLDELELF
jgi:Uma2 family endonuclease